MADNSKAYLVLADGSVYAGSFIGEPHECVGELVFTTGMTGYLETLTDPSYYGQIVMQTFPMIGNYGVISSDFESEKPRLTGYAVREMSGSPSNFRCEDALDNMLRKNGVCGIEGIDTRAVTSIIREHGVMNAAILASPDLSRLEEIRSYRVENAVASVSQRTVTAEAPTTASYSVALMDYGAKRGIVRRLLAGGCAVTVYPYDTAAETVLAAGHDGVMLSNGPGDPKDNPGCINEIKKMLGNIPVFGICLGHQLLALAAGGDTVKLKYGHRGCNQPVTCLADGRTYITTQNHGYAVVASSVPKTVGKQSYVNADDGTCEGMDYTERLAFSVQFHPEASAGPRDTERIFDRFISMMKRK